MNLYAIVNTMQRRSLTSMAARIQMAGQIANPTAIVDAAMRIFVESRESAAICRQTVWGFGLDTGSD